MGYHPRYRLPRYLLAYHTTLSTRNLVIIHIRGGSAIRYGCSGGRCLLQQELVNLSKEVSNLIILVCELNLVLLQLLLLLL
jgi:hypothetical protein